MLGGDDGQAGCLADRLMAGEAGVEALGADPADGAQAAELRGHEVAGAELFHRHFAAAGEDQRTAQEAGGEVASGEGDRGTRGARGVATRGNVEEPVAAR